MKRAIYKPLNVIYYKQTDRDNYKSEGRAPVPDEIVENCTSQDWELMKIKGREEGHYFVKILHKPELGWMISNWDRQSESFYINGFFKSFPEFELEIDERKIVREPENL